MTDKQIIFKCDVDCIRKNTEECFELDCIKGQESILKQLQAKEQECEELKKANDSILTTLNVIAKGNIKLRQTLAEIKEIAQYDVYTPHTDLCIKLNWVKKKISEVENEKKE